MNTTDDQQNPPEITPVAPARSRYRRAIVVSVLFHVVLLIVLLVWYVPISGETDKAAPSSASTDSRQQPTSNPPSAKPPAPAPVTEMPAERIEASIESQLEQVEKLSDERKLSELEKNLQRLESISDEASVQQVTSTIANSLGLEPGPAPNESADNDGEFDVDTAQLHDVTRKKNRLGAWEYQSVLVDSAGRTRTVDMTQAEGETAYNTFQQMQRFPMAAGIYRQVVMPMIQKMIVASELAEKAAGEAERMQQQQQSDASEE